MGRNLVSFLRGDLDERKVFAYFVDIYAKLLMCCGPKINTSIFLTKNCGNVKRFDLAGRNHKLMPPQSINKSKSSKSLGTVGADSPCCFRIAKRNGSFNKSLRD